MELFSGYVIDTSALLDLWRRYYPKDVFATLWKHVLGLIGQGLLISPMEVYAELKNIDDELLEWAKKNKTMFAALNNTQLKIVEEIVGSHPNFIDSLKDTPEADPFIIALAKSKDWKVVTSEKPNIGGRPRIPDVCVDYEIGCLNLLSFFRENNWKV